MAVLFGASLATAASAVDDDPGLADFRAGRIAEAFEGWYSRGLAGDARAALYVGVLYDTGLGVQPNAEQALAWYGRAASGGSVAGLFNVGAMHDAGRGTASDPAVAADYYRKAAAQGSGRAAYNLGLMYEQGSGVSRDRASAVRFFREAAALGVAASGPHLVRLGAVPVAATQAPRTDAAMLAFQDAQRILLARGPGQAAQAVVLFRQAAEAGNPLAEYNLGYCYEHGIGVPADLAQAILWYRRAASNTTRPAIRAIAEAGARNLSGQISHAGQ